jgi:hypothetical protein
MLTNHAADIVTFASRITMVEFQNGEITHSAISTLGAAKQVAQSLPTSGRGDGVVCRGARFIAGRIAEVVHPRQF